jgi:UDP-GlcNAc:undecaprenyl-phosphate GlcNAc-1-phosphate transferase
MTYLVLLGSCCVAVAVSLVSVALVRRWADCLGLVDRPGHRKVHAVPIPLGGGIGIWFSVVVTFALGSAVAFEWIPVVAWLPESFQPYIPGLRDQCGQLWVLMGGGTILMILGLMDDRVGLPWQIRLLVEFGVAGGVVFWQGLELTAFIDLPWITGLLSVVWIVMLINSFNMLDNMDGLSGGVATISSTVLAIMLLLPGQGGVVQPQWFVAAMLLVLVGGILGFLWHNWPPARIFMGDAGSYFVGYWIAIATLLATYTGYQGTTPHAVLAPLCVLAIPLYDMISVIWIRWREGRSPFEGDKRHFSHRLVDMGLTKKQAVLTIHLATLTCSLGALLLPRTDPAGALVVIAIVLCMLSLVAILEHQTLRPRDS